MRLHDAPSAIFSTLPLVTIQSQNALHLLVKLQKVSSTKVNTRPIEDSM